MTISNSSHPSANCLLCLSHLCRRRRGSKRESDDRAHRHAAAQIFHGTFHPARVDADGCGAVFQRLIADTADVLPACVRFQQRVVYLCQYLLFCHTAPLFPGARPSVSICSARTGRFSLLYPFSLRRARKPKAGQPQPPRPFALKSNYFTSVTTTAFTGISVRAISLLSASTFLRMSEAMLFVLFCSAANSVS